MSRLLLLPFLLLAAAAPPVPRPLPVTTPETWRADLDFLATALPRLHADPFHAVSKERFDAAVAEARERIGRENAETIVDLMRLAAMVGDRQTRVLPPAGAHRLPIVLGLFGSEYRVVRSADWVRAVLGGRLVRIHDTPIEEVERRVKRLIPQQEGEGYVRATLPSQIVVAEILQGLGIVPDSAHVSVTVALPDGEKTVKLPTVPMGINPRTWVWASTAAPLATQNASDPLWFADLEPQKSVYVNLRSSEKIGPRAKALWALVDEKRPERIVFDLRDNAGSGDAKEGRSALVKELEERRGVKAYVLVGNRTSAAGSELALGFREAVLARILGEPVGQNPNGFHESGATVLPHSRLVVSYATRYEARVPKGSLSVVALAREIAPTWEDHLAGRDPVLEWALEH